MRIFLASRSFSDVEISACWKSVSRMVLVLLAVLTSVTTDRVWGQSDPLKNQDVLTIGMGVQETLDPHLSFTWGEVGLFFNIFETLTSFDSSGELQPSLAVRWWRSGRTSWRFDLREGALFHNGQSLSASDVKRSLERARNSSYLYYPSSIREVRVLTDLSLEILTEEPDPLLPRRLSTLFIVSSPAEDCVESLCGTGPYRVLEFVPGKLVRLAATGTHRRGEAGLEGATIRPATSGLKELVERSVDLVEIDPTQADRIDKEHEDLWVFSVLGPTVFYVDLDARVDPLQDKRVRRALSLALDRGEIASVARLGYARPAWQLASPISFGYLDTDLSTEQNLESARALLREAGLERGFKMTIGSFGAETSDLEWDRVAAVLRQQLAKIDVDVSVKVFEDYETMIADKGNGVTHGYLTAYLDELLDCENIYRSLYHSSRAYPGFYDIEDESVSNRLDQLIDTARYAEGDSRLQSLKELGRFVQEQYLDLPLYYPLVLWGGRKDIDWQPRFDQRIAIDEFSVTRPVKDR